MLTAKSSHLTQGPRRAVHAQRCVYAGTRHLLLRYPACFSPGAVVLLQTKVGTILSDGSCSLNCRCMHHLMIASWWQHCLTCSRLIIQFISHFLSCQLCRSPLTSATGSRSCCIRPRLVSYSVGLFPACMSSMQVSDRDALQPHFCKSLLLRLCSDSSRTGA